VLDTLRARDRKKLVRAYESKEMLEYMLGAAYERERDWAAARDAYGRALAENLSFYMAHAALAGVARQQGDMATAQQEYEMAVMLRPDDALLRFEYGRALLDAQPRRNAEAEAQLRSAVGLNPHFALAYYNLAVALENQDRGPEAAFQYMQYLERAPRSQARLVAHARTRASALMASTK
jgi:superkiller protein 3